MLIMLLTFTFFNGTFFFFNEEFFIGLNLVVFFGFIFVYANRIFRDFFFFKIEYLYMLFMYLYFANELFLTQLLTSITFLKQKKVKHFLTIFSKIGQYLSIKTKSIFFKNLRLNFVVYLYLKNYYFLNLKVEEKQCMESIDATNLFWFCSVYIKILAQCLK